MMKRRIAIITAGELPIPPVKGGAVENLIYNFAKTVGLNQDFEVDIYGIGEEKEKIPNVHMNYYTSKFYSNYIKISPRIRNKLGVNPYLSYVCKWLKKSVYDYVVVENRFSYLSAIRKNTNAKVCLHMHNSHLQPYTKEKERALDNCDMIITVSEFVKREIVNNYPRTRAEKVVWHNGIDVDKFSKNVPDRKIQIIRDKYKIKSKDVVIAYAGRIIEEKGVFELIKAFQYVRKSINRECKLMLIGASWYSDATKKTEYQKKVFDEAKKIESNIIFTGYIDNSILPEYLAAADILVYPSLWQEPFGLTIVEGMCTGKPVISLANGGIPEIYSMCDLSTQKMLVLTNQNSSNIVQLLAEKIMLSIKDDSYSTVNRNQIETMKKYFSKERYYQRALEIFG